MTDADELRVSTIELFFDLVFVFTITQLTSLLVTEPTGVGLLRATLIFGNVWWMYGGYAWLTNAVRPVQPARRLLMLVGMTGFLIVALAIPRAFGSSGVLFGVGYLLVNLVHTGLFLQSTEESARRAMLRLGPFNIVTAGLLLVAPYTNSPAHWVLWTAAFVLHWASPAINATGGFRIRAAHFVERHGLIVLIALGESVVVVGAGVQGRRVTTGLIVTAVLGLALAAAMWWLYFDGEDERAERALDHASAERNPWLALFAFGYGFLPLLGGIIVVAAGVRQAVLAYNHPANAATASFLAGGVALYVVALAILRYILRTGPMTGRIAMAAAALATFVAGYEISPEAQLASLTVVLVIGIVAESKKHSDDR